LELMKRFSHKTDFVGNLGREPTNSEWSVDVRFGAHSGLKSDIA
jgi:hypothetical protein